MNTPKPCDTCKHCMYDVMTEDDPLANAFCRKAGYWGNPGCSWYEPWSKEGLEKRRKSVSEIVRMREELVAFAAKLGWTVETNIVDNERRYDLSDRSGIVKYRAWTCLEAQAFLTGVGEAKAAGVPISRAEALKVSRETLDRAERERDEQVKQAESQLPCNLPCPKCGSVGRVIRKFVPSGVCGEQTYLHLERKESEFVKIDSYRAAIAKKDGIWHHCGCCSHTWETEPLS